MHQKFGQAMVRTVTATAMAVAGLGLSQAALAAPRITVAVPCSPTALTADLAQAASGETLKLAASCTYVLAAALPTITVNLTIQGNHATLERSSTTGTPEFTLLRVGGSTVDSSSMLVMNNVNISNGDPGIWLYNGALSVKGGMFSGNATAIVNDLETDLTVTGSRFTGNTTAIVNDYKSDLTVTGATFTDNTGGYGGAIQASGDALVSSSTFTANSAEFGGAIATMSGTQTVSRCHFTGNIASAGGGALHNSAELTVSDSTFTSNSAGGGGAIDNFNSSNATLTVTGSRFASNSAQAAGGAIYNYDGALLTGDTFRKNSASLGGAFYNDWYATAGSDVFSRDTATSDGGALYSDQSTIVSGSTFTADTATREGGAFYVSPPFSGGTWGLRVTGGSIQGSRAGTDGGAIYNASGSTSSVTLTGTALARNHPDNCAPAGSVPSCTTAAATARRVSTWPVPSHRNGHIPGFERALHASR
jgi:predicted outer membrane repeat protein